MTNNTKEKSLVKINNNSIFNKIRNFFRMLFFKKEVIIKEVNDDTIKTNENKRNEFIEEIKKTENKETVILKLQRKYRNNEIKEEDLTDDQINSLCELYDRQIAELKKSNEIKKQKLMELKKLKA